MKLPRLLLCFALAACAGVLCAGRGPGDVFQIVNQTGHTVTVYLFADGKAHTNPAGGVKAQATPLANGGTARASIQNCPFSILLVDGQDVWHAEIPDFSKAVQVFTKDTGHAKLH